MKIQTVKIVKEESKSGYAIINKSDLKESDKIYENKPVDKVDAIETIEVVDTIDKVEPVGKKKIKKEKKVK